MIPTPPSSRLHRAALCAFALLAPFALACSSDATPAPTADVSEELGGGNGPFIGAASGLVPPAGYELHEYAATGTATAYEAQGNFGDDGVWTFVPTTTATYRTRILVRRPTDPAQASGTVLVEWLNVSGGVDADPDYATLAEEIVRQGHIWVGVSAQMTGVEGGPVLVPIEGGSALAGVGLKAIDAARYGSLSHPGDGYSFDIYTQVARAIRRGGEVLGGARARYVIAIGESQSAFALTTYYNGVQPLTQAFDGFFVHSRGSTMLPLVGPGESADLGSALFGDVHPVLRGDLDAPVIEVQAESDVSGVLNSSIVHQPDTERFRLWEVAGTAHADAHLLGAAVSMIDCGVPINDGPMHLVAKAAFRGLDQWVRTGTPPPISDRFEYEPNASPLAPQVMRDADGIVLGGIRTPPVDVPVDVLSGVATLNGGFACLLLGSTTPLPDARLAELYTSSTDYVTQYAADADATIAAGFVLDDDRQALVDYSKPSRVVP